MTRIGITLLAAALLTACAGTPDCGRSIAAAESAASDRLPPGVWIDDVAPACREAAGAAWSDVLAERCAPLYGFHAARVGADRPPDCGGAAFDEAWNLGEMLGRMAREQADLEARLASEALADGEPARLRRQLITIERDRPQLEAIARMQGWLAPAAVPGEAGG